MVGSVKGRVGCFEGWVLVSLVFCREEIENERLVRCRREGDKVAKQERR